MLCAAASKRLSRRARAAREDRSTASARACRRRRRTSAASDDAKRHRSLGFEPRTKRTALLPGAPRHNATARSRHRSRRSQRRIDAPHESAQESRCCSSSMAAIAAGREPWEAGTGRLDLKVQNGTVPELQIRWGVVIWGSQFSRSVRLEAELLARHTRLQPGVTVIRISALVITSNYRVITGNYQVITG
jgi:hypothetical protein